MYVLISKRQPHLLTYLKFISFHHTLLLSSNVICENQNAENECMPFDINSNSFVIKMLITYSNIYSLLIEVLPCFCLQSLSFSLSLFSLYRFPLFNYFPYLFFRIMEIETIMETIYDYCYYWLFFNMHGQLLTVV